MRPCEVCGNDIEDTARRCPYCEAWQSGGAPAPAKHAVQTLRLKDGLPTVDAAIARLDRKLDTLRLRGPGLLKVVHGWGASGTGGAIRDAVRSHLRELGRRGLVRRYLAGEDYSGDADGGADLLKRYPPLQKTLRADRQNPGITFIEL
ncbi:MAG: Smr/MutS family protein [Longimicrobiales bacterium]